MRVNSVYNILQGEGINCGIPQTMLRLQGCPGSCKWCDTPQARSADGGELMNMEQVVMSLLRYKHRWICVSGGEPLLQVDELHQLIKHHLLAGTDWEIETSGYYPPPNWVSWVRTWVTDNKCPSSGMVSKSIDAWYKELNRLNYNHPLHAIKFVVQDQKDLEFALEHKPLWMTAILRPVTFGISKNAGEVVISKEQVAWNREVAEFALEKKFRFSLQVQKLLYGQERQDV